MTTTVYLPDSEPRPEVTTLADSPTSLAGLADCGSCTAYSVSDTIDLEKAGKPLVLPHPLGGTDEPTLREWVDAATDDVVALLTSR